MKVAVAGIISRTQHLPHRYICQSQPRTIHPLQSETKPKRTYYILHHSFDVQWISQQTEPRASRSLVLDFYRGWMSWIGLCKKHKKEFILGFILCFFSFFRSSSFFSRNTLCEGNFVVKFYVFLKLFCTHSWLLTIANGY